ncbi:PIR protein, putative [Plasmodium sp. gorilla clade G1]|nr:PIR protein, putative [Plasmodium sp. gorilla clade G1]
MKVHYINILLFALPLNILLHNQRNHKSTTNHTPTIPTTRLLCECKLYAPAYYDNDPQMKEVMENFNKQTQQRFHEYDDRMVEKRKHCKDKCDKEIQKIILKDKLEKQMAQQLTRLETKIDTGDIPTCISEKSLADKTENFCLNCGINVGGGVTLSSGILGGIGAVAVNAWKPKALEDAIAAALKASATKISAAGIEAGEAAGMEFVIKALKHFGVQKIVPEIGEKISSTGHYTNIINFFDFIYGEYNETCTSLLNDFETPSKCNDIMTYFGMIKSDGSPYGTPAPTAIRQGLNLINHKAAMSAKIAAKTATDKLTAEITAEQTTLIEGGFNSSITSIYASIIVIMIIVLIMVIIYLILRYRRKKKMKKKLQYIKLLEE